MYVARELRSGLKYLRPLFDVRLIWERPIICHVGSSGMTLYTGSYIIGGVILESGTWHRSTLRLRDLQRAVRCRGRCVRFHVIGYVSWEAQAYGGNPGSPNCFGGLQYSKPRIVSYTTILRESIYGVREQQSHDLLSWVGMPVVIKVAFRGSCSLSDANQELPCWGGSYS